MAAGLGSLDRAAWRRADDAEVLQTLVKTVGAAA